MGRMRLSCDCGRFGKRQGVCSYACWLAGGEWIQGYCANLPGAVPQSIRYLPEHPLFSETRCSPSASSRESAHAGNLLSRPPHRKRSEWGWAWGVRGGGRLNYACLSGCLTRCEEQTLWKAGRREKCAGNDPFLPSCLPNLLCVKQPDMQVRFKVWVCSLASGWREASQNLTS